jgi:hypothetical protein
MASKSFKTLTALKDWAYEHRPKLNEIKDYDNMLAGLETLKPKCDAFIQRLKKNKIETALPCDYKENVGADKKKYYFITSAVLEYTDTANTKNTIEIVANGKYKNPKIP